MTPVHAVLQLLDASNVAELATLLETHYFVRRAPLDRLRQMNDPVISELLARDRTTFEDLADRIADAARAAGFGVGERNEETLPIGGRLKDLNFSFDRRNIPDAIPRLMTWFQDLAAGRNPHDRPGHFMED